MTIDRFVVLSDLHLHPWASFAKGQGVDNSRLRTSLRVLQASLQRAQDEGIPWLFAGDLVHTAGYALHPVLSGAVEVLTQFPTVPKYAIWGNHDARSSGTAKITVEQTVWKTLQHAVPNLTVVDGLVVVHHRARPITLWGVGYQPHANLLTWPEAHCDIGLFHQTVHGSRSPSGFALEGEGVTAEKLLQHCRVAIVGHVHHPQQFPAPTGQAVLIPGSPEHHNFGDRDAHGWWVLALPHDRTHDPSVEFIPGGSPEFLTVATVQDIPTGSSHFYRVETVVAGDVVPASATVLAGTPTIVTERQTLAGAETTEAIIDAWMSTTPPPAELDPVVVRTVGMQLLTRTEPMRLRRARLRTITLRDFGSHAATTLTCQDGVWLVQGQGKDYQSNGAGKTTLVGEALYWAIFGKTTKGVDAGEVVRRGAEEAEVTIELDIDQADHTTTPLRITRKRTPKGPVLEVREQAQEWSATSVADMTTQLTRYLGVTPELFQSLAYFSQERLVLFSAATDAERKEMLADLLGLSAYQEAGQQAATAERQAERGVSDQEAILRTVQDMQAQQTTVVAQATAAAVAWEQQHTQRLAMLREADRELLHTITNEADRQHVRAVHLVHHLELRRDTHYVNMQHREQVAALVAQRSAEWQTRLEALDREIQAIPLGAQWESAPVDATVVEQRVRQITTLRKDVQQEVISLRGEAERLSQEQRQLVTQHALAVQEATHARRQAEQTAQYVDTVRDTDHCNACGQPLASETHRALCATAVLAAETAYRHWQQLTDKAAQLGGQLDAHRSQVAAVNDRLAERQHVLTHADGLLTNCTRVRACLERRADMLTQAESVEQWAAALVTHQWQSTVAARKARMVARIARVHQIVQRDAAARAQRAEASRLAIQAHQAQTNPHLALVAAGEQTLSDLQTRQQAAELQRQTYAKQAATYGYWRQACSRTGLQSLLVDEVATVFNATRNDILPVLTQGVFDVQFATLSTTAKGEVREKTEFRVYQHGEEVSYPSLSGGQRRRIDLGVMLTLTLAISRWFQVPGVFGVLVLDEVFGFLDESGAEGVGLALTTLQQVIPTIYCISHDPKLEALFPQTLRVVQDAEGVSHLT